MKTIILPGYSAHNRDWAEEIARELSNAEVHVWAHWVSGENFDPAAELAAIQARIGERKFNLLAKSVGCRIAARIVTMRPEKIGKLILCGIPTTKSEAVEDFSAALALIPAEKVLVVQNRADPYASFDEVAGMLREIQPAIRILERQRHDHRYPYALDFKSFLGD